MVSRRRWILLAIGLVSGLAISLALALAPSRAIPGDEPADPTGSQTYTGMALDGPAPDFQLVDQRGELVKLSDFRGRIVVLSFLDPYCDDVCPLTVLHLRRAQQALGEEADGAVFLAVNANPRATALHDVAEATRHWGLESMPNWYFLTGEEHELRAVWQAYWVEVSVGADGDATHTPGVFLVDPAGRLRHYLSTPFEDERWSGPLLSELLVDHIRQLREAED
ncbi:SCO family protein [Thermomicrobiaceae bacterium CFH 74404]|uniref:SCO family protein n=1 Tax=Thermalbibacter longus TaxID=2951981 RepID=A0AA41WCU7_9BACT|nr:SCO family protein [Thermalbibacter longus]MCM8747970.1 SCO family protein [Thermalbibacter longus]